MTLSEILDSNPLWIESVEQKTPSTGAFVPIMIIKCSGNKITQDELVLLVLAVKEVKYSKVELIVNWANNVHHSDFKE